jgi:hypothetical protein
VVTIEDYEWLDAVVAQQVHLVDEILDILKMYTERSALVAAEQQHYGPTHIVGGFTKAQLFAAGEYAAMKPDIAIDGHRLARILGGIDGLGDRLQLRQQPPDAH